METRKRRLWLVISALLATAILTVVIVLRISDRPSTQYQEYRAWANKFGTHNWTLSEDTVNEFANSNCAFIADGKPPGWIIQNADHLKATSAVFMAYCPEALNPYLDAVVNNDRYEGRYNTTAALIRKEAR